MGANERRRQGNMDNAGKEKLTPLLIAIVGGSGSGKTWLADRLAEKLGIGSVSRLSQDDFYRDRSHLQNHSRARINFDHPRAIEWPVLEKTMTDCLKSRGGVIAAPRYDFATHCRRAGSRRLAKSRYIVVDGLWLLRRPALRRLFALSVFIEAPDRLRLQRRLSRDVRDRKRTPADIRRQFRGMVSPMHRRFVEPQKRRASIILKSPVTNSDLEYLRQQVVALTKQGEV